MNDREIHCRLRLRHRDVVMQNHRVHGVSVLPGVALLETTLRILAARGHDPARFALDRIVFTEPIATDPETDREIRVDVRLPSDLAGSVIVRARPWGSDGAFTPSMQASLVADETPALPDLDVAAHRAAGTVCLDMAELYRRARLEQIEHGAAMRCVGNLWVSDEGFLAELALEVRGAPGFYMHPGVLDAATIAACSGTEAAPTPFIPLSIDRFRALRALPEAFVLHAPRAAVLASTGEVISNDYDLYDAEGRHCATFRRLTCKRIHTPERMTRLLERTPAGRAPVTTVAPSAAAGASSYAELMQVWIGDMIGVAHDAVRTDLGFYDLGLDSRALVELASRLEPVVGAMVYPTLLFEHPHIASLDAYLRERHGPLAPRGSVTGLAEASTLLASPEWTLDGRARRERAGSRRIVAVGPTTDDVVKLREAAGGDWHVSAYDGAPDDLAATTDAVVILRSVSAPGDEAATLADVMAWTRAAARARRECDVLVVERGDRASPALTGLAAFLRSVRVETPRVFARALLAPVRAWAAAVVRELERSADGLPVTGGLLAIDETGRSVVRALTGAQPARAGEAPALPLPRGAVCVVSGGAGAIARLLADRLAVDLDATVVLLGRSAPDADLAREWACRPGPGRIEHHRCDVTDPARLGIVLDEVRCRHGGIHAVFHAAGVLADGLHLTADPAGIATVVGPKVAGFRALDVATATDDLRLFVAFSSLAAWRPNPGQGVYAFANAVLEDLVARRNEIPGRPGRAVAIAWPLWQEGGMALRAEDLESVTRRTGLVPLPTPVAMGCLKVAASEASAACGAGTVVVLHGAAAAMGSWLQTPAGPAPATAPAGNAGDIAIVGLAGRYPHASDIDELWEKLSAGHDAITKIPLERWRHLGEGDGATPGELDERWGGFVADIDAFDASLFNVSRRDAERMDPQERLFLETCWAVLEEAGHPAGALRDRDVGVFVGVMWNHYQLCAGDDVAPTAMHAAIANRVSFALDLHGPSMAVDTACSSSLTAIGLAVDALRGGTCTMAIAGGVNLTVHPEKYRQLAAGQFLSADGRCRSFGAGGTGYVPGEGVGAVLLRPLADALADGDHVWGVVRAHATNHAGRTGGFTVPSPLGQAAVVERALTGGRVDRTSIGYVEAHGTGTALGDPIEIEGLSRALGVHPERPVPIGSVKSNIGHLEGAAGIAALTKVLLMLRERTLVPSLHGEPPNPALRLDAVGLRLQRRTEPWRAAEDGMPLRAAISSFGAGGSNAHLIVDEAPPGAAGAGPEGPETHLLVLSARDLDGLRRYARRIGVVLRSSARSAPSAVNVASIVADLLGLGGTDVRPEDTPRALGLDASDLQELRRRAGLSAEPDPDVELARLREGQAGDGAWARLADVAYTLQLCRTHLDERLAVVVDSLEDAAALLEDFAEGRVEARVAVRRGSAGSSTVPLERMAERWVAGGAVDFEGPWRDRRAWRIQLPVPALRRERFWLGMWRAGQGAAATREAAIREVAGAGSTSEPVSLRVLDEGVALVRMQDVAQRNMLTDELVAGLEAAFSAIAARDDVRAVVLTGTDDVFSMGGTPQTLERLATGRGRFTDAPFIYEGLARCRVPVVAAMRGQAAGGGLTLGLHADQVILDRDGIYSANFVKFGFTPGLGATYALERRFGPALAGEMLLTGAGYRGRDLEARGTPVRFADTEDVLPTALRLASAIAANGAKAIRALKAHLSVPVLAALPAVVDREVAMHARVLAGDLVPGIRVRTATAARRAPAPDEVAATAKAPGDDIAVRIRATIEDALCAHLFVARHELQGQRTFREMGVDSLGVVEIVRDLNHAFGLALDSVLVYDYPTIDQLTEAVTAAAGRMAGLVSQALASDPVKPAADQPRAITPPAEGSGPEALPPLRVRSATRPAIVVSPSPAADTTPRPGHREETDDIAIIGMSARYPGSPDLDSLWNNLIHGRSSISEVTPDRWDVNRYYDPDQHAPGKTTSKWAGLLGDVDRFDAAFFGISPREAELMDPQQRVFLEQAWRALEHAGYAVGPNRRLDCGVFVGTAAGDYLQLLREARVDASGQVFIGNSCSILAARIAYFLNLSGPTVALDTACSSSLVALHLACQAIRSGDCEMALAGGVALMLTPQMHVWNAKSGMLSPGGRCAAFDASADGFVLGEGVGVVVVKRLSAALSDRDHIHAVVKASGVNGDGKSNGITAPSAAAQVRLLERVLGRSGVSIDDLGYIETHGAGTQLGDPIEWKALATLLRGRSRALPPCGIGSIKTNVGHTTLAAGIAGLLKVVLALEHGEIPPSLHFERMNPNIDVAVTPLRVVTERQRWPIGPSGRRFGAVNSFGVSGTNAHVILAEAPAPASAHPQVMDRAYALPLSAKTPQALREMVRGLQSDLERGAAIADVAFTLGVGRAAFRHRFAVVATDSASALALLSQALGAEALSDLLVEGAAAVVGADAEPPSMRPLPAGRPLSLEELSTLARSFVSGADVDFSALYAARSGRRIPLSGYALADRRFWVPVGPPATASADAATPPPREDRAGVGDIAVEARGDWLVDHRVDGQTLVPGAAALHHAAVAHGSLPVTLTDIEWLRPVAVSAGAALRIRHRIDASGRRVTELGLGVHEGCARVLSSPGRNGDDGRLDVERIAAGCSERIEHDQLYQAFADAGIEYGPTYRRVDRVTCGGDKAVGWLRPSPDGGPAPIQTIDAILQVAAALEIGGARRMPRQAERVVIHRPVETSVTVAVARTDDGRYDVTACDAAGAVTVVVTGFRLAAAGDRRTRLYTHRWRTVALPLAAGSPGRTYVLLDGVTGIAPPRGSAETELVVDVRSADEAAPEQALQALRTLFARLARAGADDYRVVVVTAGAAAVTEGEARSPLQSAMCGLARSAGAEHPAWRLRVVDVGQGDDVSEISLPVAEGGGPRVVARRTGVWHERELASVSAPDDGATPFRDGLTYLIVGGAGGLGFALSRELSARHRARIAWIGRRPLDVRIREQMAAVADLGGTAHYERADIGDPDALKRAIRAIRGQLGPISGAVHSAIVLDDVPVAAMTGEQLERVLRPKVTGVRNLCRALEGEPIDHLIFFSSVAALLDAPGQGNYAAASAYLDAYALELRRRYGVPTFVVDWGYWGSVGIVADGRRQRGMAARGVGSIEPADGFACLRRQLASGIPEAVVLNADHGRFAEYGLALALPVVQTVVPAAPPSATIAPPAPVTAVSDVDTAAVVAYVRSAFAAVLKTPAEELDVHETFETFGVDSLLGMDILRRLKNDLGPLPSTLLYERLTIAKVAGHLVRHHRDVLGRVLSGTADVSTSSRAEPARAIDRGPAEAPEPSGRVGDIAIVGLTGRYPGAPDVETFWENLRAGRRSISEVPPDRWDWRPHFDASRRKNRTYNAYGGFIDGVDLFDPQFFGILPSEAAAIDPQERLFLEACWELLEQAGHNGTRSREPATGVFVGVMYGSYGQIAAAEGWRRGEFGLGHSAHWSIANRVSYHFDFTGPSLAVDTACSASLTAVHLACESLRRGECRQAIAGGVNLVLHAAHHIALSAMNMLGTGPACRTFDATADGIVPGEGVGAVLLRPLADAIADGDEIWAVIRGSMVNAGGKTGGYTVPSPSAQADVIRRALSAAGVRPAAIGCVEVHGTGTQLGDPIEVAALNQVFGEDRRRRPVQLGSVKANIGHLEGAAGIAGVTKAVLQLRHAEIAPCAGLDAPNANIDFTGAVEPARMLHAWADDAGAGPRAMGVSSFGAGGANAHVILEAWDDERRPAATTGVTASVFLLSARSYQQFRGYAQSVAAWLARHPTADLRRLCFTSQVGRHHLSVRSATLATSLDHLAEEMRSLAAGASSASTAVTQRVDRVGERVDQGTPPEVLLQRRRLEELAAAWVEGAAVEWAALWKGPQRLCSFPTVPFERRRFWMPTRPDAPAGAGVPPDESWLESLARDHRIQDRCVVPGAALLEAMLAANGPPPIAVRDVRWLSPVEVGDGLGLEVERDADRITLRRRGHRSPVAVLTIPAAPPGEPAPLDLTALRARCSRSLGGDAFYARLGDGGFRYGPSLRPVRQLVIGPDRAIAELEVSNELPAERRRAVLVDGAMQVIAELAGGTAALPASIGTFVQYAPLPERAVAVVDRSGEPRTFALHVCSPSGHILVELSGLRLAPAAGGPARTEYLRPVYVPVARGAADSAPRRVVVVGDDPVERSEVAEALTRRGVAQVSTARSVQSSASTDAVVLLLPNRGADAAALQQHLGALCAVAAWRREHRGEGEIRLVVAGDSGDPAASAVAAATRTLALEHAGLRATHLHLGGLTSQERAGVIAEELLCAIPEQFEVRFDGARRIVRQLEAFVPERAGDPLVRLGGVYVVTGGAGALGRLFAGHLLDLAPLTVALLGRSAPSAELIEWMKGRSVSGRRVVYVQVDVAEHDALRRTTVALVAEHGPIRGVLHAAGVRRDGLAAQKSDASIAEVVRPKVTGVVALDAATSDQPLDFFVACSSLAGEMGNIGQIDYAAANRFLADFVADRERLLALGQRQGVTVTVEWPLWQDGAMTVDPATTLLFAERFGMVAMPREAGLAALDVALAGEERCFAVVQRPDTAPAARPVTPPTVVDVNAVRERLVAELRAIGATYLLVDPSEVDLDAELADLGFSSISLTDMVNTLNARYGLDLLPTVLFEFPTLRGVAGYLATTYGAHVVQADGNGLAEAVAGETRATSDRSLPEPIAIVGMAGRLAGASSLSDFWDALVSDRPLIGAPAPGPGREALLGDPVTAAVKGGFLADVAAFDAEAFGISPREAALMDPQQRLFLESVSEAMQDAGHAPEAWAGRAVGVFAGVSTTDYDSLMTESGVTVEPHIATGVAHSMLANRVSHVFDWHGPSEVIDTACSSSLVALHRAVRALRGGECEVALVGGVNVILAPGLFRAFAQAGMLSGGHSCRSFDARADGYVRGEGVGVVVLRPLSRALADGDHVYAVVLGSAVNHGGKSTSLTAPNPAAQADVIERALTDAGVDPRSVTFIETHGTGTPLGDPVEIEGLKRAYARACARANTPVSPEPWVHLGAVKTALGHLEAAAGIAGLLRTVLSLWHGRLTANRNWSAMNPHIRLEGSPFRLLTSDVEWHDGASPRRAGVSSFGFGGTNAHVVLEAAPRMPSAAPSGPESEPRLFPLSAPSAERLARYADALAAHLDASSPALADVAYTLQHGRARLSRRIVVVPCGRAELRAALLAVAAGDAVENPSVITTGDERPGDSAPVRQARRWLRGNPVTWPEASGRRVALPAVPFARTRHWFHAPPVARAAAPRPEGRIRLAPLAKAPSAPPPTPAAPREATPAAATPIAAVDFIVRQLAAILLLPVDGIDPAATFDDLGLDSIFRVDLIRSVNGQFGLDLKGADLYEVKSATALGRLVDSLIERPPASAAAREVDAEPARTHESDGSATIGELIADVTGRRIAEDTSFADAGLTSFDMLRVIARLESAVGPLPKALLFDQPTARALARWLEGRFGLQVASGLRATTNGVPKTAAADRSTERLADGKAVVAKHRLAEHPDLAATVARLEARWGKEGGLPGRDIAPLVFIGADGKGHLNFSERDGIVLAWSCAVAPDDFPALVGEWVEWAAARSLRPNLLSMVPVEMAAGVPFRSTMFGTVQRIEGIQRFSLEGGRMQRLRQRLHKFKRSGAVAVAEYRLGREPAVDARIVTLVDQWSARKEMVNGYVARVRAEIARGALADRHRVYLTSVNGTVVAAVIVTRIPSEHGYLLDLEFFGDEMADGGLDYTIVEIVARLAAEGCDVFSLGATLGVAIGASPNPHPAVEQALRELRESGLFRGDGNFQFKNRFRPRNLPVYLCQPADASAADVLSVILMIADPTMGPVPTRPVDAPPPAPIPRPMPVVVPSDGPRRAELRRVGWNVLALPRAAGVFDLVTDSWAERGEPAIADRMREIAETSMAICHELSEQMTLPFAHVQAAPSGRAAEAALLHAIGPKRTIVQNNLFPSWTFNALDLGFRPVVVRTRGGAGDVDVDHLAELLALHRETVGLCCIELAPNATGGLPISMENAREVNRVAGAAGVPLVFDATRGLENACLIAAADGGDFWTVARELFSLATAVTLSMPKAFGVSSGGLVATGDPRLMRALRHRIADRGEEVSLSDRRLLASALDDRPWIERAVRDRVRHVQLLAARLRDCGAPVQAAGGHAILLDAAAMCGVGFAHATASALAWLYESAGVRAAPHLASGLTRSEGTIRLAIPVGLSDPDVERLGHELVRAFREGEAAPDLLRVPDTDDGPAFYHLRDAVPDDVAADVERGPRMQPAGENWAVVREWQPDARRSLVPHEGGHVEVFDAGDGPPVVLLHPFNIGLGFVAPQFRDLVSGHRVIGVHAPGVGATTAADDLSFRGLARTVLAGVRGIGVRGPFVVAGASFGGLTALALACRYPGEVSGLVLLGSSHKVGNRRGDLNRLAVVARADFDALNAAGVRLESREEIEALLLRCESIDPKVGLRYLDEFAACPDLLADAAKLQVPTLIVHGVHDSVIAVEIARRLYRAIPGAMCVELPDAGHFPSLTSPAEVNVSIAGFVRRIDAR